MPTLENCSEVTMTLSARDLSGMKWIRAIGLARMSNQLAKDSWRTEL
jgi:hypothetical protein